MAYPQGSKPNCSSEVKLCPALGDKNRRGASQWNVSTVEVGIQVSLLGKYIRELGGYCMAYKITDDCISCGTCEDECDNNAISEGEGTYLINPDRCTECVGNAGSPKCAEVCPMNACVPDPGHAESKEQLIEKWRDLHPGEPSVYAP